VAKAKLRARCRLPLDEVSALCVRRGAHGQELLAVGDELFSVIAADLLAEGVGKPTTAGLGELLPVDARAATEGSEWEGVAADSAGRVFVLKESSGTVLVFSPDLKRLVQTIQLDVSDADSPVVRGLFVDRNAGVEAILLLPRDELLIAKQRDPIVFVRFGRPQPDSNLSALHSWTLPDDEEKDVESVNDIALDARGRLHAVSSKSRRIYRLALGEHEARIDNAWKLAEEIDASKERKLVGLAFDADGLPIVAVDTDEKGDNVFLLERLEG
jgi:SdiA-regulated